MCGCKERSAHDKGPILRKAAVNEERCCRHEGDDCALACRNLPKAKAHQGQCEKVEKNLEEFESVDAGGPIGAVEHHLGDAIHAIAYGLPTMV